VSISLSDNWADYKHGRVVFRYEATLQARSATPSSGFVEEGTSVTVQGSGFDASMELQCLFGRKEVQAQFLSSTSVACVVPAHSRGMSSIGVLDEQSGASSGQGLPFEFLEGLGIEKIFQ